jgi:Tol biopolymer transport system component
MADDSPVEVTEDEVNAAVQRICSSVPFASSERLKSFLRFVVCETLAGRAGTLKEYTVGVAVYDRGSAFDPKADSIVRTEARRLRSRLEAYYATTGIGEPIRIDLPRGSYVPSIRRLAPILPPTVARTVPAPAPAPPIPGSGAVVAPTLRTRAVRLALMVGMLAVTAVALGVLRPAAKPAEPVFSEVSVSLPVPTGSISRDGRFLAFHDNDGNAWRLDRQTMRTEKLTFGPDQWDSMRVPWMVPSPDGTRLAYAWMLEADRMELRLMAPPDGPPRIVRSAPERQRIRPVAWSADSRRLLFVLTSSRGTSLEFVNLLTGEVSRAADLGAVEPLGVSMTDDASWVAYDHAPSPGPRDITLLETSTGRVRRVVSRPGDDVMPTLIDGGRALVFVSGAPHRSSLWRQELDGGRASGPARMLKPDVGGVWSMGATRTDTLVYGTIARAADVHIARLDSHGRVSEQASPLGVNFPGGRLSPAWSPDGRTLVYVEQQGIIVVGAGAQTLVRWDRPTRTSRRLYPPLASVSEPRWSPDGTRLLVLGRAIGQPSRRLHIVDARTGGLLDTIPQQAPGAGQAQAASWLPDGNGVVAFVAGRGIVHIDLATRSEQLVVPMTPTEGLSGPRAVAFARDGQRLAYSLRAVKDDKQVAILSVRTTTGATRELLRAQAPDWLMLQGWSPDGRSLLVVRQFRGRPGGGPERRELWRVPVDGTSASAVGVTSALLRDATLHPHGTAVAYIDGAPTWTVRTLTLP